MPNGLDVVISKDPFGESQVGDHQIGISAGNDEWGSFFFETLKATFVDIDEGESSDSYAVRYQATFEESLKDFPLLARISEFYQDAAFAPDEIDQLEKELNRAAKLQMTDDAEAFLDGMLLACRMAKEESKGILLSCQ
jgi:sugar/nucleoside kinase (ribokinase family)